MVTQLKLFSKVSLYSLALVFSLKAFSVPPETAAADSAAVESEVDDLLQADLSEYDYSLESDNQIDAKKLQAQAQLSEGMDQDATEQTETQSQENSAIEGGKDTQSLELNLAPVTLIRDYPVSGGIGISGEKMFKSNVAIYIEANFSRYYDLKSNPLYDQLPEDHESMKVPFLDHTKLGTGVRYYMGEEGNRGAYLGANMGLAHWEADYKTKNDRKIIDELSEGVVGIEAGYKVVIKEEFLIRVGVGLGWSLPISHEVRAPNYTYEKDLAKELKGLKPYRERPMIQLGYGHSF